MWMITLLKITNFPSTTTALSGAVAPQTNAVQNLIIRIIDPGTTDDAPTKFNKIVFNQGATFNGVADWSEAIADAELSDNLGNSMTVSDPATEITATSITFSGINTTSGQLGYIPNISAKFYTLKIWLKTTLGGSLPNNIDNKNFIFKLYCHCFVLI